MLNGKKILLGVTGSIAAYKAAVLTRLFIKAGAEVKVIMTPSANDFITPLTLSVLSKNPVLSAFTEHDQWNNHVELGLWADFFVIAPASANTISKMANGGCDNLLIASYLSSRCPVYVAPAMDEDMVKHGSTLNNLSTLKNRGNILIAPKSGELASGLYGEGRMEEPESILKFIVEDLEKKTPLNGLKALVTAGPTYEAIDPVRFIGNHSSGKMGFALAKELADKGAEVVLVTGPTSLILNHYRIKQVNIVSSEEMEKACLSYFPKSDITIMAAAVADYKPLNVASQKIKKEQAELYIKLKPTSDILSELGKQKKDFQLLIGFALETQNEEENAKSKLKSKNLDLIILNSPNDKGAAFGYDTNKITIIDKSNKANRFELKLKSEIARDIVQVILNLLNKKPTSAFALNRE